MVTLTYVHILFVALILAMLALMAFRKSIVLPCVAGILVMGWAVTKSAVGGVQALFNALIWSGSEFWGIIVVISLVTAMSKAASSPASTSSNSSSRHSADTPRRSSPLSAVARRRSAKADPPPTPYVPFVP